MAVGRDKFTGRCSRPRRRQKTWHLGPLPASVCGTRRLWLRGRDNVHGRYLLHVAGHDLKFLMRRLIGAATPNEPWHGDIRPFSHSYARRSIPGHPPRLAERSDRFRRHISAPRASADNEALFQRAVNANFSCLYTAMTPINGPLSSSAWTRDGLTTA